MENKDVLNILDVVKEKHRGTTGMGEKIYDNITQSQLTQIISKSILYATQRMEKKIDESMKNASDEWDVVSSITGELRIMKNEFENTKEKKHKPK